MLKTEYKSGEFGTKEIFDTATKSVVMSAIDAATRVKQTQFGKIEEYVAYNNDGAPVVKVRENYIVGRSSVIYNGRTYTKKDCYYCDGSINPRLTDAESPASLNTINEQDFADVYGCIAVRAERVR